MSKRLRLLLIFTVPVFVFVNIYQTYSYQQVDRQVTALQTQQRNWLEHNKRIIAGIAVLSSPQRIDQIAQGKLGLKQRLLEPTLRIHVPTRSGTNDG